MTLAEETGVIVPLGRWVLESACAQLASWAGRPETAHLVLAVNVSVQQIRQPDFVELVQSVLVELTESLLMGDVDDTIRKMTALKAKGLTFALDDFGTDRVRVLGPFHVGPGAYVRGCIISTAMPSCLPVWQLA